MPVEQDPYTKKNTTGHEWDGIKELDTPIPKILSWSYFLTLAFGILYWVLYPAFPGVSNFTRGILEYSSRSAVLNDISEASKTKRASEKDLLEKDLDVLVEDQAIKNKYINSAAVLYKDHCAVCHGRDLKGQTNFPNLRDKHWLWSGELNEVEATIKYGINSGHDEERISEMLGFESSETLNAAQIADVVHYVLSLSHQAHDAESSAKGEVIFKEQCVSCHGEKGEGGLSVGAPSLSDRSWIYGNTSKAIHETISKGRKGVMPAWDQRLSPTDIRKLTLYLKWKQEDARDK
ncbi:MAG: Cbb3-type cytochrome c oxidase subunit FixP [Methyloligella sp.]|nr:MAG: Cbb3-type cytochrome c oxidase subunit FixP [Methyloligella sp.]